MQAELKAQPPVEVEYTLTIKGTLLEMQKLYRLIADSKHNYNTSFAMYTIIDTAMKGVIEK
jgi:hypothetical protein